MYVCCKLKVENNALGESRSLLYVVCACYKHCKLLAVVTGNPVDECTGYRNNMEALPKKFNKKMKSVGMTLIKVKEQGLKKERNKIGRCLQK